MAVVPGGISFAEGPRAVDALVSGKLAGYVNPRRLTSLAAVPCVADEYRDLGGRHVAESSVGQELRDTGVALQLAAGLRQMVKGRQGVGLAAAELRDQRHHWRGVLRPPGQIGAGPCPCAPAERE